eukprot:140012-Pyramimonas_sp.AAC.1
MSCRFVLDNEGNPFETQEQLASGLLQHFAKAEEAAVCDAGDLAQACNHQQQVFRAAGPRDLSSIMSRGVLRGAAQ